MDNRSTLIYTSFRFIVKHFIAVILQRIFNIYSWNIGPYFPDTAGFLNNRLIIGSEPS